MQAKNIYRFGLRAQPNESVWVKFDQIVYKEDFSRIFYLMEGDLVWEASKKKMIQHKIRWINNMLIA